MLTHPRFSHTRLFRRGGLLLAIALLLVCGSLFAQDSQAQDSPANSSYDQGQPQSDQFQDDRPQSDQSGTYPPGSAPADQGSGYGNQPYADSGPDYGQAQQQPLSAGRLEQLVAPIALYPDALVAQVLAASTYPQQVADADRWRQEQGYASADQIASGADAQNWDPSVKALAAFPEVLSQMDRNLQWTTDLGNAYYNQPQDVLEAVQVMRQRAQAAGTLRSTPQEAVSYDGGNIELAPVDPQIVYVPTYNPWAVYGEAVAPYPGFSLLGAVGSFLGSAALHYGFGIAMTAFAHTPWGFLAWGLDWLAHSLMFHQSAYYSHSATVAHWGFPHHGFYAYAGRAGFARTSHDYARGWGNEGRGNRGWENRSRDNRSWGNESWRHSASNSGGWHTFDRGPERRPEVGRGNFGRSFTGRSFDSRSVENRSIPGRSIAGVNGFNRSESYRASAESFSRGESGGSGFRSGGARDSEFRGGEARNRSSESFARSPSSSFGSSSFGKSHSGGLHLFGGGHSEKSFSSRSGGFGGGRAPKESRGAKSFEARNFGGKNFGGKSSGAKSFGGGHSHGGGGHSGGHGGGKHHG